jgi:hypothetical protein
MDGKILLEKVWEIKPKQARSFLFITGSVSEALERFFEENHYPCLKKPFTPEELLVAIEHRQRGLQ